MYQPPKYSPSQIAGMGIPANPQAAMTYRTARISDLAAVPEPPLEIGPSVTVEGMVVEPAAVVTSPLTGGLAVLLVVETPEGARVKVIAEPGAFRLEADLKPGDRVRVRGSVSSAGPLLAHEVKVIQPEPLSFAAATRARKRQGNPGY